MNCYKSHVFTAAKKVPSFSDVLHGAPISSRCGTFAIALDDPTGGGVTVNGDTIMLVHARVLCTYGKSTKCFGPSHRFVSGVFNGSLSNLVLHTYAPYPR